MNPKLDLLQPYPFEKLRSLKNGITPPPDLKHIALSVGEPKHAAPQLVLDHLQENLHRLEQYPTTAGLPELRQTIADWLIKRFALQGVDFEKQVLPVNGTREALFAAVQALFDDSSENNLVVSPNPFYQIYEGAAYLAGGKPYFIPCTAEQSFAADFESVPAKVWQKTQMLFLCSPGNPTGTVLSIEKLQKLIQLADEHDFLIFSDECYSEIYTNDQQAPAGLLQACANMGRDDFDKCLVFHSLSKRSNLPGLRSGFVAGDANLISQFLKYRTYHGCAMSIPTQLASIVAWNDEAHVEYNRDLYTRKFDKAFEMLEGVIDIYKPDAGFYLWAGTPESDTEFAQKLFAQQNITALPGSFLSREVNGHNPGANRIRMALVATIEECEEAFNRIIQFVGTD